MFRPIHSSVCPSFLFTFNTEGCQEYAVRITATVFDGINCVVPFVVFMESLTTTTTAAAKEPAATTKTTATAK